MKQKTQPESEIEEIFVLFDPNDGSPYAKRRNFREETITSQNTADIYSSGESTIKVSDVPDSLFTLDSNSNQQCQSTEIQCQQNGGRPLKTRRVISKCGERNFNLKNLPHRSKRYYLDLITTIIDTRWRVVLSIFLVITFGCWTFFAMFWCLISYAHNDLSFDNKTGLSLHEGSMTCVNGASTFTGFFLLSFEIQTTVGFGERSPNEECPEAVFLFIAQIVVGVAIDSTMIAIIYAKLTRPARKPYLMKFSRKAVVCQRDGKMCLMFRICDPNEMHVIHSRVHACLIGELISTDGHNQSQFQHPLTLQDHGRVLVIFPLIVCHVIDDKSPLYSLSATDFLEKRFEVVVTFTGTSPSTGQTKEERTSYLSREIAWGHRFINTVEYDYENGEYFINYDLFEVTEEVETPLCSARSLDEIGNEIRNCYYNRSLSTFSPSTSKSPNPSSMSPISIPRSPLSNSSTRTSETTAVIKEVRFRLSQHSLDQNKKFDELDEF